MKIVMMEPLGISNETLDELSRFLKNDGHEFIGFQTKETDEEKLIERIKDAEILILANQPLGANVIEKCKKLKMISVGFTGVDHIAIEKCKEKNITVCNACGYATNAVAELTFGLIISVLRYILECDKATRIEETKGNMIGSELCTKTIGIIGTGAIGLKVSEIAKAFGCKVIAYSRTKKEEAVKLGIKYKDLDTVLSESDIISLHVPATKDTACLINKEKINLMKPEAILINTSRGAVVDSEALAEALIKGQLAGAGIDVFEMEPPIPSVHPLLNCPNTVVTPHVAFATTEAMYKRAIIVFENIKLYLNGNPQNLI